MYLILVQNHANFAFFAVQATARVDVQLLTVADQEQIVEVIKVILQELVPANAFFFRMSRSWMCHRWLVNRHAQ